MAEQLDLGLLAPAPLEKAETRPHQDLPPSDSQGLRRLSADLHVHIGRNGKGQAVKITASPRLTLPKVVEYAWQRKGLDIVGVIDCACTGVLQDLRKMVEAGQLLELPEGGLRHRDQVTLIAGAEVEAVEAHGGVSHHLCYFPYLKNLAEFSRVMSRHISNMELSSQRCGLPARELLAVVLSCGGVLVPAHAFTPHKSVYGNAADSLAELFGAQLEAIPALELGLSATTELADHLPELRNLTLLSNSDAHSLEKMAREYMILRMAAPNFKELMLAWKGQLGRGIEANYGVDPALGRYHRSYCLRCQRSWPAPQAVLACPDCGALPGQDFLRGVYDRILQLSPQPEISPPARPPYVTQVPLGQQPGLGKRRLDQLVKAFGSEMQVLHQAPASQVVALVGPQLAQQILAARQGVDLTFEAGAGGRYGRVLGLSDTWHQPGLFDCP